MRDDVLTLAFGVIWIGAGVAMLVHFVGLYADWWTNTGATWWVALSLLVALIIVSGFAYLMDQLDARRDGPADSRVFDGEIRDGFRRYRRREHDHDGEPRVEIVRVKRTHRFGSGYEDAGRPRSVTSMLHERDAWAVRDLLDDWLSEREGERGEKERA